MNRALRNPWTFAMFLVPTLIFYVIFMIFPVVQAFHYGFTQWNGISSTHFNGLANFNKAFHDPHFWRSVLNNVYFILFSCFVQVPLIILFALLISKIRRFKRFYKTVVFTPSILSTAVIGILWSFIYEPDVGILNQVLKLFGIPPQYWLSNPHLVMLSVLITNAWQWIGFYVVLVLAAILGVPRELNEAAEIDGAGGFQAAVHITIPLIRPVINVVILMSVAGAMKAFDIVYVMTQGGPFGLTDVMATYMVNEGMNLFKYGYGSAVAVIMFVFTLVLSGLFQRYASRSERMEM